MAKPADVENRPVSSSAGVSFAVIEGVGARLIPPRARRVQVPPGRHTAWLGDAT